MDLPHSTTTTTTNQNTTASRAEAERLLGIAEKLLQSRDLTGSREFALLAQETEPFLEGSDQILAITDVLIASEKRVNDNRHHDWYGILQTERRSSASEPDLIKKNYRRLALLLHPDKNRYPLADSAFKLVADAWAVLSDPSKRTPYDHELSLFSKVDLRQQQQFDKDKLPVRRSPRGGLGEVGANENNNNNNYNAPTSTTTPPPQGAATGHHSRGGAGGGRDKTSNFWTACPYCYVLYEYPKVYKECCMRCQNCERAFHAAAIPSLPPMVPGKEAYYCCWGFFPLGFRLESKKGGGGGSNKVAANINNSAANNNNNNAANNATNNPAAGNNNNSNANMGFPNWMPGMFTAPVASAAVPQQQHQGMNVNMNNMPNMNMNVGGTLDFSDGSASAGFVNTMSGIAGQGGKKRGRPRKNSMGV